MMLAVNSAAYLLNSSGSSVANNATTAGSGLALTITVASSGVITAGGAQSGTWKNITGASVADGALNPMSRDVINDPTALPAERLAALREYLQHGPVFPEFVTESNNHVHTNLVRRSADQDLPHRP